MSQASLTAAQPFQYLASYNDLAGLGADEAAGWQHFAQLGLAEGRAVTFSGLRHIASHRDLIRAYGANEARGLEHWFASGFAEGRSATAFNPAQYLANYADVRAAVDTDLQAATRHYVQFGAAENRVFTPLA